MHSLCYIPDFAFHMFRNDIIVLAYSHTDIQIHARAKCTGTSHCLVTYLYAWIGMCMYAYSYCARALICYLGSKEICHTRFCNISSSCNLALGHRSLCGGHPRTELPWGAMPESIRQTEREWVRRPGSGKCKSCMMRIYLTDMCLHKRIHTRIL